MDPILEQRYNKSVDSLQRAGDIFDKIQDDVREQLIKFLEKLILYSAGIISLTLTFITGFLGDKKDILLTTFWGIPLYYYLFSSWILFGLNIITGLTSIYFDNLYLYSYGIWNFAKKNKDEQESMLDLLKSGRPFVFANNLNHTSAVEDVNKRIEKLDKKVSKFKISETKYYKLKLMLKRSAITFFASGLVVLIIFILISTFRVIVKS